MFEVFSRKKAINFRLIFWTLKFRINELANLNDFDV